MAEVYLGLGSNLGNREANLRWALRASWRMGRVEAVSALYETDPVGSMPEQPPFYNACCRLETGLEPLSLLRFLKSLEHELGRRPGGPAQGPRPLDLDVLLFDERVIESDELTVPHPRLAERPSVLVPLADIAAQMRHPQSGKTVAELLATVGSEGVRRVGERGWERLEGMESERLRI